MHFLLIFFIVSLLTIRSASISETSLDKWNFEESATDLADMQWEEFKVTYNKQYKNETEELYRKKIFMENVIKVAKNNVLHAKGEVFTPMGINRFTDMNFEEFFNTYANCLKQSNRNETNFITFIPPAHVTLSDHVDWRDEGAVTPIKDQGLCGSCYSFAITGTLEGQHFRKNEELVSLSEQNIIDCASEDPDKYGDSGCCGGLLDGSLAFIAENGGIDTEESYPYEAKQDHCRYDPLNKGATVSGIVEIKRGREDDLKAAVASNGPVAVAINVQKSFKNFLPSNRDVNQVYYEPDCVSGEESLTHAVLVVGYGTDPEDAHPDYWIVKNSWSELWGDKGYIKMARNENNHCGIATSAFYPTV